MWTTSSTKPSVPLLKKLNRLGFQIMGDMNWHGHMGIATLPMKIAALHKIPLVVWGEHGYADLCGQFSMNDFVEWSYRNRLEHFGRGYEWTVLSCNPCVLNWMRLELKSKKPSRGTSLCWMQWRNGRAVIVIV